MIARIESYEYLTRSEKLEVKDLLSQKVLEIVEVHRPNPVLEAEVEAQITEAKEPVVLTDGTRVVVTDSSLVYALDYAVRKKGIMREMRGNQLQYRLPADPIEAGHVTL